MAEKEVERLALSEQKCRIQILMTDLYRKQSQHEKLLALEEDIIQNSSEFFVDDPHTFSDIIRSYILNLRKVSPSVFCLDRFTKNAELLSLEMFLFLQILDLLLVSLMIVEETKNLNEIYRKYPFQTNCDAEHLKMKCSDVLIIQPGHALALETAFLIHLEEVLSELSLLCTRVDQKYKFWPHFPSFYLVTSFRRMRCQADFLNQRFVRASQ